MKPDVVVRYLRFLVVSRTLWAENWCATQNSQEKAREDVGIFTREPNIEKSLLWSLRDFWYLFEAFSHSVRNLQTHWEIGMTFTWHDGSALLPAHLRIEFFIVRPPFLSSFVFLSVLPTLDNLWLKWKQKQSEVKMKLQYIRNYAFLNCDL